MKGNEFSCPVLSPIKSTGCNTENNNPLIKGIEIYVWQGVTYCDVIRHNGSVLSRGIVKDMTDDIITVDDGNNVYTIQIAK